MTIQVRSFAKINLGLYIGAPRADGFHGLRTVYQTIALHDVITVSVGRGTGIEIACDDERVPLDSSNTCWRVAERVIQALGASGRITIVVEKRLPVQGGMGAASSNAVSTMIGLERVLRVTLPGETRFRIAAEVGSDLPQFLVGGTSLGMGRGDEVFPLPDFPAISLVVVTPEVGVSTPRAFADWDALIGKSAELRSVGQVAAVRTQDETATPDALTHSDGSDRLLEVSRVLSAWLSGHRNTGAPAKSGSRAGSLLSDLVRTGIENDFEKVVFPQYPELRDIKHALVRAGAGYASLSGSGSTVYGLFRNREAAARAARRLHKQGLKAIATTTIGRARYWKSLVASR